MEDDRERRTAIAACDSNNNNEVHDSPSARTDLTSNFYPSPASSLVSQKIWGAKYSLHARDALLCWTQQRRNINRKAMIQRVLDLIDPADREDALRYAQIEADFQVKQFQTTMELGYLKWKWETEDRATAEVPQRVAIARDKTRPQDFECAWSAVDMVDAAGDTGIKPRHEDKADPEAADKWGPPPQYDWDATETTADDGIVAHEDEPWKEEQQISDNNEIRWDEEDFDDGNQAVLEAFPRSLFDGQRGSEPASCSEWTAPGLSDEGAPSEDKIYNAQSRDHTSNVPEERIVNPDMSACEQPLSGGKEDDDMYPGADIDDEVFYWQGHAVSQLETGQGETNKEQNSKTDETTQSCPTLLTPPPSPKSLKSSSPSRMAFDHAWKRLAHILMDMQWRDYIQSWYRGTHALKTRDLYKGSLLWTHLSNRTDAIRKAELDMRLRRHTRAERTIYAVMVPQKDNDNAAAVVAAPSSSSSSNHQQNSTRGSRSRDCSCHPDQGGGSNKGSAECPYNWRRMVKPRECPCGRDGCELGHSRLRRNYTMRELLMDEETESDSGIDMS